MRQAVFMQRQVACFPIQIGCGDFLQVGLRSIRVKTISNVDRLSDLADDKLEYIYVNMQYILDI